MKAIKLQPSPPSRERSFYAIDIWRSPPFFQHSTINSQLFCPQPSTNNPQPPMLNLLPGRSSSMPCATSARRRMR